MNVIYILSMQLCIVLALYYILILLMHKCGVISLDEWRKSSAKEIAHISRFLKRIMQILIKYMRMILGLVIRFTRWIIRTYNGQDILEMMQNPILALTDTDIIELTRRLSGNPYDSPTYTGYLQDIGVNHYEFCALDLKGAYSSLTGEKLVTKVLYVVRNYILETRRIQVDVFIETATSTRLVFAIPLSEYGRKSMLQKQSHDISASPEDSTSMLTEQINIMDAGDDEP